MNKIKNILCFVILITLCSCASTIERLDQIGKTPPLKKIDPPVRHSYNEDEEISGNPNSLWKPGARAFFKDPRARRIGDILKVQVKLEDDADFNNSTDASREAKEDMNMKYLFGLEEMVNNAVPVTAGNPQIGISAGSKAKGSGKISRKEKINIEIAAMIKQVLPNGNLLIQGSQEARVNNEVRELLVSGIIRPEDISAENVITSDQIAEARISYGGRGIISDRQKPRWGQELLDIILPF